MVTVHFNMVIFSTYLSSETVNNLKHTHFYGKTAPNCIKDFLDLLGDSGQSGLTLQLFQMVILVN